MTSVQRTDGTSFDLATCPERLGRHLSRYDRVSFDEALDLKPGHNVKGRDVQVNMLAPLGDTLKTKFISQWNWLKANCSEAVIIDDDPNHKILYLLIPQRVVDATDPRQFHEYAETLANDPELQDIVKRELGLEKVGLINLMIDSTDANGSTEPLGMLYKPYACIGGARKLEVLGAAGDNNATQDELRTLAREDVDIREMLRESDARRISSTETGKSKWVVNTHYLSRKLNPNSWNKVQRTLATNGALYVNRINDPRATLQERWFDLEPIKGENPVRLLPDYTTPSVLGYARNYLLSNNNTATFIDNREHVPPLDNLLLDDLDREVKQLEARLPANVESASAHNAQRI